MVWGEETTMPKKRSHKNNETRLTVPELVDAFWKSGVYPTKRGVLELVQRAVKNALAREKRKHKPPIDWSKMAIKLKPNWDKEMAKPDLDARAPLFSTLGLSKAMKRTAKR